MKNLVLRFVSDESGATAIEYGLIAAGISVAIIAVVQGIGPNDAVVASGAAFLTDGDLVRVIGAGVTASASAAAGARP